MGIISKTVFLKKMTGILKKPGRNVPSHSTQWYPFLLVISFLKEVSLSFRILFLVSVEMAIFFVAKFHNATYLLKSPKIEIPY